jgi:hypothetical protein
MASYRFHVQQVVGFFEGCEFHHVPRAEKEAVDTLSKLDSSMQEIPPEIALAHLRKPSIKPSSESESIFVPESHVVPMDIDQVNSGTSSSNPGTSQSKPEEIMSVDCMEVDMPVFIVREAPSWVKPIMEFLVNGGLPAEEVLARRIQRREKPTPSSMVRCTREVSRGCYRAVWNQEKARRYSEKSIKENVGTMPHQEPLSRRLSGIGSIGPLRWKMWRTWSGNATGARDTTNKFILQLLA